MSTRGGTNAPIKPNPMPQFNDTPTGRKKVARYLRKYIFDEYENICAGVENRKLAMKERRKKITQQRRKHAARGEYYIDEKTPPIPILGQEYIERMEAGCVEDFYERAVEEHKITIEDYENEVLKLIGLKTKFERDILQFDPSKPKQKQKIVFAQFEIRKINERLAEIEELTGIVNDAISNNGPKGKRIWNTIKEKIVDVTETVSRKASALGRGISKFFKKFKKPIVAICSVIAPCVVASLFGTRVSELTAV